MVKLRPCLKVKKKSVKEIINWSHKGPPEAVVRDVEVEWQDCTGEFDSFSVKYSW